MARGATARRARRTELGNGDVAFDLDHINDEISRMLDAENLVPTQFRGTDKFIDVVSWNIQFFNHKDPVRVDAIAKILGTLNADIFVLCEIADDGALDQVVEKLAAARAGFYEIKVGRSGGNQRVCFLYDLDWVRAKQDIEELFKDDPEVDTQFGVKRVFDRRPLHGYFQALGAVDDSGSDFDFQLLGLHLKAQRPPNGYKPKKGERIGVQQRSRAAELLVSWMETTGRRLDGDILMAGDFNATPSQPEWAAFKRLERRRRALFGSINDEQEVSHLWYRNSENIGSRLDMHLVTDEASKQAGETNGKKDLALVVKWNPIAALEGTPAVKDAISVIKERFSDHLPVLSRFYVEPPG
jgi:exonuclease III